MYLSDFINKVLLGNYKSPWVIEEYPDNLLNKHAMSKLIKIDSAYKQWFAEIIERIRSAQIKAALSINSELLSMYYDLGKRISTIKADTRWGGNFFQNLSTDLRVEFPDTQGFSETNLRYIVKFYRFYSDSLSIPPQFGEK